MLEARKIEVIWSIHLEAQATFFSFCWVYLFHTVFGLFCVRWSLIGATLKNGRRGIFWMVAIEIRWLVSQILSVRNGGELAVWFLTIWSVSRNTGNYFTVEKSLASVTLLPHVLHGNKHLSWSRKGHISLYTAHTNVLETFVVGSLEKRLLFRMREIGCPVCKNV